MRFIKDKISMIDCIIVDDAPLAVDKLKNFISKVPSLRLVHTFENGMDAFTYLRSNQVDLIFLDIQMEQFSGLQLLEALHKRPYIIIVSAYGEYAVQGFEYDVVDYLLKPYSLERFLKAVNKVEAERASTAQPVTKECIFLKTEYRMVRINLCDILFIEGQGAYLHVITDTTRIMTLLSFKEIEALLPSEQFIRIHKSYLIAINKIDSIERNIVRIGNMRVPVGKSYLKEFYERLR